MQGPSSRCQRGRDIDVDSRGFLRARALSPRDVKAAVESALVAGTIDVLIYCHRSQVGAQACVVRRHSRGEKPLTGRVSTEGLNTPGFDESFDAVFFIG